MSYEKCKGIKLDKKNNKVWVNVASSNVYPHTYYKCEYGANTDLSFEEKLTELFLDIEFGNIHCQESMYNWTYALTKTRKEGRFSNLYDRVRHLNNIYYTDNEPKIWWNDNIKKIKISEEDLKTDKYIKVEHCDYYYNKQELEEDNKRIKALKEDYYETFKKYLEEKHEGQYYLYSNSYGYIRNKGTRGSFYYNLSSPTLMDYKKAYCLLNNIDNERYGIEIKEFIDKRTYIPTEKQLKEKEERLNILGIKDNTTDYKKIYDIINKFENEYKALVYYVSYGYYNFGKCYNLFYVSDYEEEYEQDKDLLRNNETYSYVYNETDSVCSEIGLIGFNKTTNYCNETSLKRTF